MKKANPEDMRKSLIFVDALKKAGVLFVPVPVLNHDDHKRLIDAVSTRLLIIDSMTEEDEPQADKETEIIKVQ